MPIPCWIVLDDTNTIVEADDGFCRLTGETSGGVIGTRIVSFFPLEDRTTFSDAFARLREEGGDFTLVERLMRRDGTHCSVSATCAEIAPIKGGRRFAMRVRECPGPADRVEPGKLLALARTILHSRRRRAALFGAGLFPDCAWDMLLSIYIAEAEGRIIDLDDIHAHAGTTLSVASRWIRALEEAGLVEHEPSGRTQRVTASLRLTAKADALFETYLSSSFALPDDTPGLLAR